MQQPDDEVWAPGGATAGVPVRPLSTAPEAADDPCAQDIAARIHSLAVQVVQALAAAVDAKDHYTHLHSRSVAALAGVIARRMGLSATTVDQVSLAALLHDVGKIGIPDAILHKPGPLDPLEQARMRQHPALGGTITGNIDALREISPLVRAHHERWDGLGYPDGLKGRDIPLPARIVAVVDSYDAMISDRVYQPARSMLAAAEELQRRAGTQFDPEVVSALVDYVRERVPEIAARLPSLPQAG